MLMTRGVLAVSLALASGLPLAQKADATALTVTIEGLRNGQGEVSLGLYASDANWPSGRPMARVELPAAAGTLTYTFSDLKPGYYALSGYHDENANGLFDTNFLGLPKEGFVFSRDYRPRFPPPHFDDCVIALTDTAAAITVHLQYWSTVDP